jgi:hypothetical protein
VSKDYLVKIVYPNIINQKEKSERKVNVSVKEAVEIEIGKRECEC